MRYKEGQSNGCIIEINNPRDEIEMSAKRGVEIHNGYVKLTNVAGFQAGVEATPITQGIAGQVVVSAVINAIALGGAVKAGEFIIFATVTMTADLVPLRAKATVNAGIIVSGFSYGLHVEQEVFAAGQITEIMDGIRIEQYVPTGGLTYTVHGIFIQNTIQTQPSANYFFQRMTEGGGVTVEAAFYIACGGASDMTDLFVLAGTETAWTAIGAPTGPQAGYVRMRVAGVNKAIQLYDL